MPAQNGMHIAEDAFIAEIIDPETCRYSLRECRRTGADDDQ